MEKHELSPDELRFNDESNFLDTFYDFHPDWFNELAQTERKAMQEYYMYDREMPDNVFMYRKELLKDRPTSQAEAQAAYEHFLKMIQGE